MRRLGRYSWAAVALIIILIGGFLWLRKQLSGVTAVTELLRDPSAVLSLEHPLPPRGVIRPTSDCDAGEHYRQAIQIARQDPARYELFMLRARESREARPLDALQPLLDAAGCSRMTLFSASPEELIRYGDKPSLQALRDLGRILNRVGALLVFEKSAEEAQRYHRAAFALGAGMFEERVTLEQMLVGVELMSEASAGLLAAGAEDAALGDFRRANIAFYEQRVKPVQRVLTSVDPAVIAKHGGDVIYIARNAPERMWRIEAILSLGRMRFHSGSLADQRAAERELKALSDDADRFVRAAAKAALDLTLEQYRTLR